MKWADYGISAVRYDRQRVQIIRVKVHPDKGDMLGPPNEYDRTTILDALRRGVSFVTITADEGNWHKGEPVMVLTLKDSLFLRTDQDEVAHDELARVPEF